MSDPKKFHELRVGDSVADMHDGLKSAVHYVVEPLEAIDLIQFRLAGGHDFIQKLIKPITYYNKHLVVIDDVDYERDVAVIRCMYSYDDIFFGTVKLRIKQEIPQVSVYRNDGWLVCADSKATGEPTLGYGHSILEAIGDYCMDAKLVRVVAEPPELLNTDYRISRSINTAKLVREGCDRR